MLAEVAPKHTWRGTLWGRGSQLILELASRLSVAQDQFTRTRPWVEGALQDASMWSRKVG